jgi:hypothetical protein
LFERAGQNDFDQIIVSGVLVAPITRTGDLFLIHHRWLHHGLAFEAAMGLFKTYAELGTRAYTPYRGHMFEWFVQDSWKVKPNLRLEYGLRHSIIQPFYSLWRNIAVFDQGFYDPSKAVTQDPRTGFIGTTGDCHTHRVSGDGFQRECPFPIELRENSIILRGVSKEYSRFIRMTSSRALALPTR